MTSIGWVVELQLPLILLSDIVKTKKLDLKKKGGGGELCRLWNIRKPPTECLCRTYGNSKAVMY